jgi:hypothetical protein
VASDRKTPASANDKEMENKCEYEAEDDAKSVEELEEIKSSD